MSKHTPGPWHVGGAHGRIVYAANRYAVANAATYHGRHDDEANARVIAAAPDLLAAAIQAEAVLARGKWLESSTDPEAVALRALRAAIEKAVQP